MVLLRQGSTTPGPYWLHDHIFSKIKLFEWLCLCNKFVQFHPDRD